MQGKSAGISGTWLAGRGPHHRCSEVLRDKRSEDRPKPRHKHVWAEMIREVEGQPPVTAKDGLFCQLFDELAVRNLGQERPVVCLMDGERSLWDAQEATARAFILAVWLVCRDGPLVDILVPVLVPGSLTASVRRHGPHGL